MENNYSENVQTKIRSSLKDPADILKIRTEMESLCKKSGFEHHYLVKVLSCISDIHREFIKALDGVESSVAEIKEKDKTGICITTFGKIREDPASRADGVIFNLLKEAINRKLLFFDEIKFIRDSPSIVTLELVKWSMDTMTFDSKGAGRSD